MAEDVSIRLRAQEGAQAEINLLWDTAQSSVLGELDWLLGSQTPSDPTSFGLSSGVTISSAVLICLFTWRRADPGDPYTDGEVKGWWGDAVDVEADEAPIGSKLWTLQRAPLTAATQALAKKYATQALQPLVVQGLCARIDIAVGIDKTNATLPMTVKLYSSAGGQVYNQQFASIWSAEMLALQGA